MPKMPPFCAVAVLLSVQLALAANPPGVTLVRDGNPACTLVVSKDASPSEKRGAQEIRAHLKLISGADIPISTDAQPLPPSAILVGRSRFTDQLNVIFDQASGPDAFTIKTAGQYLAIVGSRTRGTLYGCTELLEKIGVRWYTPKVTFTPKQQTITIDAIDEKQSPAFEYREAFFTEAFNRDWAARMRFNGNSANLDESTGGKIQYHPFVHSFDTLVPRSLYPTHPEYFPLIQGKRKDGYVQRCLSNPDALKLTIEKVRQWMKERPDATIYSVSQNDCYDPCQCDACKAIEARYGGVHSGLYLWFVNQVAQAIENECPDKLIDTLAYQFTEEPPTGIVPRKNVRVRLCPISVCEAHPYEKCSFRANVAFVKNLAAWAKITDTLYIWHYNTNFSNYLLPFPDFEEFPADTRLYQRSGVKGIFFQGAYGPGGGGSDAELRSYVMAKLLWNPSRDSDALVHEWMAGVYGPAKEPLRKWFDLLHDKARDPNHHIFIFGPANVHYLSPDVLAQGDKLFDEAEKLAAHNPIASEYVAKSRLWLRYAKLAQKPTGGPEFTSFMADVRKFGIGQIREAQSTDAWEKEFLNRLPKPNP